jgi:hypothetical protein
MPKLDMRATAAGVALSIVVAILGFFFGFPPIGELIGAGVGGYLAGRTAGRDGLFHGGAVGIVDVIGVAIVTAAGSASVPNVVIDTAATVLTDALLLGLAALGGWLATRSSSPSSSAGRDRDR